MTTEGALATTSNFVTISEKFKLEIMETNSSPTIYLPLNLRRASSTVPTSLSRSHSPKPVKSSINSPE